MLRRAGLLGGAVAASGVLGGVGAQDAVARADRRGSRKRGYLWLTGDHHIHTQYSNDGKYRVIDQVRQGSRHGLDWMVITDHGNVNHSRIGVEKVNPDIREARREYRDALVFQGLEWNIPAAEHGTVFVHPGRREVDVLRQFEVGYDGRVKDAGDSTPENEALAIAGLNFLAKQVKRRKVADALMLANHPARKGIDSPHEIRGWRDAQPKIAVGMEGAPGHQAAGIPAPQGMGRGRGLYDGSPGANSFPGYPALAAVERLGAAWGGRRLGSAEGAAVAAAEHAERDGGRAVVYPGVERLTGTVMVGELLARTAIDGVRVLGGGDGPQPGDPVRTRGHVRPKWRSGRLVLELTPAAGGGYTPFEVPNPTPCCADHG